ncbi:MAG: hypothetical protein IPQ07_40695 [Myxococcales bacterium]|nr:hypothetical protein [Myxococcales bacterium]
MLDLRSTEKGDGSSLPGEFATSDSLERLLSRADVRRVESILPRVVRARRSSRPRALRRSSSAPLAPRWQARRRPGWWQFSRGASPRGGAAGRSVIDSGGTITTDRCFAHADLGMLAVVAARRERIAATWPRAISCSTCAHRRRSTR